MPGDPSGQLAGVPAGPVEDLVTGGKIGEHRPAGDAQAGGHGPFAGCQQGPHDQNENAAPGRVREDASKRLRPDVQDIRNRITHRLRVLLCSGHDVTALRLRRP